MSLFSFFKKGLQKTSTAIQRGISGLFTDVKQWDDDTYRKLEEILISTDLGPVVTKELIDDLKDRYARGLIATAPTSTRRAPKRSSPFWMTRASPQSTSRRASQPSSSWSG